MTDDVPSIAELQRIEREDLAAPPWPTLDHWTPSERGQVAIRNAAPVLLEIAAAAVAHDRAQRDAAMVRHAYAGDSSERAVLAIARHDADEVRARAIASEALAKVRP